MYDLARWGGRPAIRSFVLASLVLGLSLSGQEVAAVEFATPEDLALRVEYGVTLALAGDVEKAERVFVSVLSEAPGDPRALTNLGNLHLMRGWIRVAQVFYDRALKADSTDAGILLNLSVARMLLGDEVGAREEAAAALKMLRGAGDALSLLGVRGRGRGREEGKASSAPVLSEDEIRALLDAAASCVPVDSVGTETPADSLGATADDSASGGAETPEVRPKVWRSAGLRATDRAETTTTLYWKR